MYASAAVTTDRVIVGGRVVLENRKALLLLSEVTPDRAAEMICKAQRPLGMLGAGSSRPKLVEPLSSFIRRTRIPFFNTQMGKGSVTGGSNLYMGTAALSSGDYVHRAVDHAEKRRQRFQHRHLRAQPPRRWITQAGASSAMASVATAARATVRIASASACPRNASSSMAADWRDAACGSAVISIAPNCRDKARPS